MRRETGRVGGAWRRASVHVLTSAVRATHVCAELNLDYIMDNPWLVVPISALRQTNVNSVVEWLIRQAK